MGSAEECDQCREFVVKDSNGIMHTCKIVATHQCLIPEDAYTLLGDDMHKVWVVGRQLPGENFEKVSVFVMDGKEKIQRVKDLHVYSKSRNVLV